MSADKPILVVQHDKTTKLFAKKQHLAGHCLSQSKIFHFTSVVSPTIFAISLYLIEYNKLYSLPLCGFEKLD